MVRQIGSALLSRCKHTQALVRNRIIRIISAIYLRADSSVNGTYYDERVLKSDNFPDPDQIENPFAHAMIERSKPLPETLQEANLTTRNGFANARKTPVPSWNWRLLWSAESLMSGAAQHVLILQGRIAFI